MKKIIIISFVIIVATTVKVFAQCAPDPIYVDSATGFYPNTLSDVVATVPYNTTITIVVETYSGYSIDSLKIVDISNLPTGLTFTTNNSRNTFVKGSGNCMLISGTVAKDQVGPHKLAISVIAYGYAGLVEIPYTENSVSIIVKDLATNIETTSASFKFEVFQNFPNPLDDKTQISFTSPVAKLYTYQVTNMVGATVYKDNIIAKRGVNEITFQRNSLMPGMYFYKLSDGQNSITKRMIIKD